MQQLTSSTCLSGFRACHAPQKLQERGGDAGPTPHSQLLSLLRQRRCSAVDRKPETIASTFMQKALSCCPGSTATVICTCLGTCSTRVSSRVGFTQVAGRVNSPQMRDVKRPALVHAPSSSNEGSSPLPAKLLHPQSCLVASPQCLQQVTLSGQLFCKVSVDFAPHAFTCMRWLLVSDGSSATRCITRFLEHVQCLAIQHNTCSRESQAQGCAALHKQCTQPLSTETM